jgi:uncharacterized protein (TIGR01777 family)
MNILITGATGFIGQYVTQYALTQGHKITIITRNQKKASKIFEDSVTIIEHNLLTTPLNKEAFNNIESIINLMGENIADKRWNKQQKELLYASRIQTTHNLLKNLPENITSIISASALGIYASGPNSSFVTEDSPPSSDFLGQLCQHWESEVKQAHARSVFIRIGAAIGKEGGILKPLLPVFKLGLGGPIGKGKQLMSWMHVKDLAKLFVTASEDAHFSGAYNAVVGEPITNKFFSNCLAKSLNRTALFPVPPLILKIVLGSELGTIALQDQAAISTRLQESGFEPEYKTIQDALVNI